MSRNAAYLHDPGAGSRDRYLLIVRHDLQRVLEQRAFARESDRDEEAVVARARHGAAAVTCGFVRNFAGRAVTRVWL